MKAIICAIVLMASFSVASENPNKLTFDRVPIQNIENPALGSAIPVTGKGFNIGEDRYETDILKTLIRTGTQVGDEIFGQVYNYNDTAVDGWIHWALDFTGFVEVHGKFWMLNHWESRIGMLTLGELEQNPATGELSVISIKNLNFKELIDPTFHYISEPCSGSVTPWKSFLSSQEYPFDPKWFNKDTYPELSTAYVCDKWWAASKWSPYPHVPEGSTVYTYYGKTCDPTKDLEELIEDFYETYVNIYWNGIIIETQILNADGDVQLHPRFALGRFSAEKPLVMPDEKTVYIAEDRSTQCFWKFVADTSGDLSCGHLYAAKVTTVTGFDDPENGELTFEWVDLGYACDSDFSTDVVLNAATMLWFDTVSVEIDSDGKHQCPEGYVGYLVNNHKSYNSECIKLKDGLSDMDIKHASRLESQRYAAVMGATQEFSYIEGIDFDSDLGDRLYIGSAKTYRGMATCETDDPDCWDYLGSDHLQFAANSRGCVFEMLLNSDYDGLVWRTLKCGHEGGFKNPDNLGYVHGHDKIILCEDASRKGPDMNYVWAMDKTEPYDITPIIASPVGAEMVNGYTYKMGDFTYLVVVQQHPYEEHYDTIPRADQCSPIGEGPGCDGITGTGDWLTYMVWPSVGTNVTCVGQWSTCNEDCQETYQILTHKTGTGADCPNNIGDVNPAGACSPGDGMCPLVCSDKISTDGMRKYCSNSCDADACVMSFDALSKCTKHCKSIFLSAEFSYSQEGTCRCVPKGETCEQADGNSFSEDHAVYSVKTTDECNAQHALSTPICTLDQLKVSEVSNHKFFHPADNGPTWVELANSGEACNMKYWRMENSVVQFLKIENDLFINAGYWTCDMGDTDLEGEEICPEWAMESTGNSLHLIDQFGESKGVQIREVEEYQKDYIVSDGLYLTNNFDGDEGPYYAKPTKMEENNARTTCEIDLADMNGHYMPSGGMDAIDGCVMKEEGGSTLIVPNFVKCRAGCPDEMAVTFPICWDGVTSYVGDSIQGLCDLQCESEVSTLHTAGVEFHPSMSKCGDANGNTEGACTDTDELYVVCIEEFIGDNTCSGITVPNKGYPGISSAYDCGKVVAELQAQGICGEYYMALCDGLYEDSTLFDQSCICTRPDVIPTFNPPADPKGHAIYLLNGFPDVIPPTCPASDTDSLEGNVTGAECMCSGTSCAVEVGSFCTVAGQCVAAEVEDDCGACSATCGDASRTCAKLCKVGDLEVEFEGNCDGSDAPTVEDCDLESCGDGIDAGAMEITMFLAVFLVGLLF